MNVLITGGAGFIGYHLARRCAERGDHVTIMDNFIRGADDKAMKELCDSPRVRLVRSDITDPRCFATVDTDYDIIYHLAAINGTENFYTMPDRVLAVGVLGALNVLEWYSTHRQGRLIIAS